MQSTQTRVHITMVVLAVVVVVALASHLLIIFLLRLRKREEKDDEKQHCTLAAEKSDMWKINLKEQFIEQKKINKLLENNAQKKRAPTK